MGSQEVAAVPDLPRRDPYGTLLGSSIVFAVIVLLVGTLVVVDNRLSGAEEIAPGTTLEVGNGVSYVPADGWFVSKADTQPGSKSAVASQGASFSVQSAEWRGTAAEEVERTRRLIAADKSIRLAGDGASFHTAGGLTGTRLELVGPKAQGRAWVAVDEQADLSVVVYAVSLPETAAQAGADVDGMLASIRANGGDR